MLPLCADQGVGVIPWSPLARGRLTRDWDEVTERSRDRRVRRAALHAPRPTARSSSAWREVAEERGVPRAQVALAWMLLEAGRSPRRSSAPPSCTTSTTRWPPSTSSSPTRRSPRSRSRTCPTRSPASPEPVRGRPRTRTGGGPYGRRPVQLRRSQVAQIRSRSAPSNSGRRRGPSMSASISASVGRAPPAVAASRAVRSSRASLDEFRNTCGFPSTQRTARLMASASFQRLVPAEATAVVVVGPSGAGRCT